MCRGLRAWHLALPRRQPRLVQDVASAALRGCDVCWTAVLGSPAACRAASCQRPTGRACADPASLCPAADLPAALQGRMKCCHHAHGSCQFHATAAGALCLCAAWPAHAPATDCRVRPSGAARCIAALRIIGASFNPGRWCCLQLHGAVCVPDRPASALQAKSHVEYLDCLMFRPPSVVSASRGCARVPGLPAMPPSLPCPIGSPTGL